MAAKKVNFRLIPVPEGQTELDEQISNTKDDLSASDQENEEDSEDELRHDKLVKAIGTLSDKGKKRLPQRSEPNLKVSEYHLSEESNKVELHDLVGALQYKSSFGNLKKKLDGLQKNSSVLDVPLPKPQAEQVVRSVAYDETAKDISKWAPIVKKNREAEHLSFPMNAFEPNVPSVKTMTVTFKPRTPLEQEIAAVLSGSAHVLERNDKELSKDEEEALMAMDLEEAKERRRELQRLKALQSYYEQKCKRQKKIKSKKYHRIKRRAEKRAASKKSIEDLQKEDPEKAKEELQKADRLRVMERMSLKHKNTSKWAKNLLIRGHKDPETKRALAEQLQISHELTKKTFVESEDEEQETPVDKDEVDDVTEAQFAGLVTSEDNPWSLDTKGDPKVQASNLASEHESSAKIQRLQPITKEDTGEAGANEPDDSESDKETEDEFELQPVEKKGKNKKERKKMDRNNKEKTNISKKKKKKLKEDVEEQKRRQKTKEKKSGKLKKSEKKKSKVGKEKEADVALFPSQSVLTENSDTGIDFIKSNPKSEDRTPNTDVLQEKNFDKNKNKNRNLEAKLNVEKSTASQDIKVDPKKFFRIEDYGTGNEQPGLINEDDQQLIDIRQAFANDDVIEEFVQEKDDIIASLKPKDVDLFLPGWGEWAGAGVKPSARKRKKFLVPAEPAAPRKDEKLAHVIINEERNKRFAKHQVRSLPFPYTNQVQFERSIHNPLGPHWNTPSMVKELTKPKVSTLPGVIIDPIQPTKEIKRRGTDQDEDKEKYGKRTRKDGSQSALIVHN